MVPFLITLLLLIALGIVIYAIAAYRLINKRNKVANAWSQIDVQLKRRFDLIKICLKRLRLRRA